MPKSFPGGKITNPFTEVASKDLMVFELRRQMRLIRAYFEKEFINGSHWWDGRKGTLENLIEGFLLTVSLNMVL